MRHVFSLSKHFPFRFSGSHLSGLTVFRHTAQPRFYFLYQKWIAQCFLTGIFQILDICVWFLRPLLQQRNKMSFALQTVRKQSQTALNATASLKAIFRFLRHDRHLRIFLQNILDRSLVLVPVKGTGRINQFPARRKHLHGTVENLALQRRIIIGTFFVPALYHRRIAAEHTFAGARRIDQNLIKKLRQDASHFFRCLARYTDISRSEHFQIFKKRFCARIADIIGKQDTCTG